MPVPVEGPLGSTLRSWHKVQVVGGSLGKAKMKTKEAAPSWGYGGGQLLSPHPWGGHSLVLPSPSAGQEWKGQALQPLERLRSSEGGRCQTGAAEGPGGERLPRGGRAWAPP